MPVLPSGSHGSRLGTDEASLVGGNLSRRRKGQDRSGNVICTGLHQLCTQDPSQASESTPEGDGWVLLCMGSAGCMQPWMAQPGKEHGYLPIPAMSAVTGMGCVSA